MASRGGKNGITFAAPRDTVSEVIVFTIFTISSPICLNFANPHTLDISTKIRIIFRDTYTGLKFGRLATFRVICGRSFTERCRNDNS